MFTTFLSHDTHNNINNSFLILKMKGIPLSVTEYVEVLKVVAQSNAIGKLFTVNFEEICAQEKYIFSFQQRFIYFPFIKISWFALDSIII